MTLKSWDHSFLSSMLFHCLRFQLRKMWVKIKTTINRKYLPNLQAFAVLLKQHLIGGERNAACT